MADKTDLRIVKGKETRQQILNAALALLIDEGPQGFSAGKLAKRAKVSKASLFHHFVRIDEVPFALLEEIFMNFGKGIAVSKPRSVEHFLLTLGNDIINAPAEKSKVTATLTHFYLRSAHDEKYRALQEKATKSLIDTITATFENILGRRLTMSEKKSTPLLAAFALEGLSLFCIPFENREGFQEAWKLLAKSIDRQLTRAGAQ